jgi:hypothetical protein
MLCSLGGLCASVFARLAAWLAQSRRVAEENKSIPIAAGSTENSEEPELSL